MSFQWRLLLKVAVRLLDGSPEERHIRSAINRAYYAAFGEARVFAIKKGLALSRRAGSHQQVWNFLRGAGAPTVWEAAVWKAIGDQGLALTADRKLADYDESATITLGDAQRVITIANEIIKRLLSLPQHRCSQQLRALPTSHSKKFL
jgi:uncharacterized protein (UPF0332 family)